MFLVGLIKISCFLILLTFFLYRFMLILNRYITLIDGSSPRVLIDQSQQHAVVKQGANHLLRCSAESEPFPDMTWEKDGKVH